MITILFSLGLLETSLWKLNSLGAFFCTMMTSGGP